MEVLHEVALPYTRRLESQEEEELPTQDALSMEYYDDSVAEVAVGQRQEKERLEGAAGVIDEDRPLPDRSSSNTAQAMARMQLLCTALRARLTPVNKSSGTRAVSRVLSGQCVITYPNSWRVRVTDAWKVILRIMATSSVTVLDAFKVERFRAFAELPYRSLLYIHPLWVGMCIVSPSSRGARGWTRINHLRAGVTERVCTTC
jgi:hypothetical protein